MTLVSGVNNIVDLSFGVFPKDKRSRGIVLLTRKRVLGVFTKQSGVKHWVDLDVFGELELVSSTSLLRN